MLLASTLVRLALISGLVQLATGSTVVTMTMGVVLVACLAARIAAVECPPTRTSTLSCTSSATRPGTRSRFSLGVAILNQDVFSLNDNRDLAALAGMLQSEALEWCGSPVA